MNLCVCYLAYLARSEDSLVGEYSLKTTSVGQKVKGDAHESCRCPHHGRVDQLNVSEVWEVLSRT